MKETGKTIIGAFVVSGCIGLVCEVLIAVISGAMGITMDGPGTIILLLILGIAGAVLAATPAYQAIEKASEFGIMGSFMGFAPAAAGMFIQARTQGMAGVPAALKAVGMVIVLVLAGVVGVAVVCGIAIAAGLGAIA